MYTAFCQVPVIVWASDGGDYIDRAQYNGLQGFFVGLYQIQSHYMRAGRLTGTRCLKPKDDFDVAISG